MPHVCPACGAEHPPGARFCSSCGASLQRTCPNCGAEQPAGAAFCSSCGIALKGDARRGSDLADERQERRVVTVLFADLAGSTALGESLDPEEIRELQGELFELVNKQIEGFGGTSEKFVGDAVLAVFGIPLAHEDDPERAVRAALAVQDSFGAFVARVRDRHRADVGLRVGVNTGDVVAGREAAARGELMVSGDAVNVAARLQQNAEPGEVLVGQRTHAATARVVEYGPERAVEAKGKQAPLPAWAALSAGGRAAGARGVEGLSAPMIGRDEELAVLEAVATRVERERSPQVVTLFGPAGVGKSRLLAELVDQLPGSRLLKGRCLPYGEGVTYWPLAEALKVQAGVLETDTAEVVLAKLRATVESVVPGEHVERVLEAAAWTTGVSLPAVADPLEVGRRLEEGWARYVAALGREQLTVVVVEDIHWGSRALLDLLERLADSLVDTAVVLVCTARLELLETRPTWGAGRQNATTLSLAPLSPSESEQLVVSLLGEAHLPDDVRNRVLAGAEGNPFFLEEMLQMLIEQGALERRGGRWASTERLARVTLPDSVHGVIAARVDLLPVVSREALRRCSVVGRVFWPAAVEVDEDLIAALGRSGLVSDRPESVMAGMREFAFKHALTRDVVYATLPRPERRELHRRVAEWIQSVAPDRSTESAELAAYHYGQAIAYGEDDPAVSLRAFELLLTASEAAFERGAQGAARLQLDRALELAEGDRQQARAQVALMRVDQIEGRHDSALARFDRVEGLLGGGDAALRSEALGVRSRVCWLTGRWEEALAAANAAVSALEGLPESRQLARALARRSQIEMLQHRPEAIEHASEAVAVARRVGDAFAEVNARINLFTELATRGVTVSPDELYAVVPAARDAGEYEEAYRAIVNFIWSALGYLPVSQIEAAASEARRLVADTPPPGLIGPYLELTAAMLLVPAGRWAEAEAIPAAQGEGPEAATARIVWLWLVGGLAFRRGDLEAAAPLLTELRSLALASGEPQRIVPMACIVLPWLLIAGERDELRSLTEETLAAVGGRWPVVLIAVPVVRALAAAGETALLGRVADSMRRTPYASVATLEISLTAAEGLLALEEGRPDEAVEKLTKAAEAERELGFLYDAACLELDLAAALDAAGEEPAAEKMRQGAAAFLDELGVVNPF